MNIHKQPLPAKFHSEESGFSLIELLVVVLIIGILAGVMIPRFISQRDASANQAAINTMRNAETQLRSMMTMSGDRMMGFSEMIASGQLDENKINDGVVFQTPNPEVLEDNMQKSGNGNNPNTVFLLGDRVPITDPNAANAFDDYGGMVFCVGSKGTKNYCAAYLVGAPTKRWTLSGDDNSLPSLASGGGAEITPGSPSTPATVTDPVPANGSVTPGWQN